MLHTDRISEAMNEQLDCFGEHRLSRLVEEHGHLPSEELHERILREIETFGGTAAQHDDMPTAPAQGQRACIGRQPVQRNGRP